MHVLKFFICLLLIACTCFSSLESDWHEIVVGGEIHTSGRYTLNCLAKVNPSLTFDVMEGEEAQLEASLTNAKVHNVKHLIYERVGYGIDPSNMKGRYSLCKARVFEKLLKRVQSGGMVEYRSFSRSCTADGMNPDLDNSFVGVFGFKPEFETRPELLLAIKNYDQKVLFNLSSTINNYLKENYFKETVALDKGSETERLEAILKGILNAPNYPKEIVVTGTYTPKGTLKIIHDHLLTPGDYFPLDMRQIKPSYLLNTYRYFNENPVLQDVSARLISYGPFFYSYSITAIKK
jgi:hypothetical protein